MVKFTYSLIFILFTFSIGCTQVAVNRATCADPEFDEKVSRTIRFAIPTIGVDEVYKSKDKVVLLDTREKAEFNISHIPDAVFVGYQNFQKKRLANVPQDAKIVVYCSIGYRSERIGEQLEELGYTNVYNLYGSIFEWVNRGYRVVDAANQPTKKIHTYNKKWSQWVKNDAITKVW